jgi:hypothetical protein
MTRQISLTFTGTVPANGKDTIPLLSGEIESVEGIDPKGYAPFRNAQIVNQGSSALSITFNQSPGSVALPGNSNLQRQDDTIKHIILTNDTASATDYSITFDNKATVKSILRDIRGKL